MTAALFVFIVVAALGCGPKNPPKAGDAPRLGSWAISLGSGGYTSGSDVAVDAEGNIIVAGSFDTRLELGDVSLTSAGAEDGFVAKLTGDGQPLWAVRIGGTGSDKVGAVAIAPDGAIIVAISYSDRVVLAQTSYLARGAPDALIAALDPSSGSARWVRPVMSTQYVHIADLAIAGDGTIAACGVFAGTVRVGDHVVTTAGAGDALVATIAADGTPLWAARGGAAYADAANGIAITDDLVVATGGFTLRADFAGVLLEGSGRHANQDVFVAAYTRAGELRWVNRYGGVAHDAGLSVQANRDTIFVGGAYGIAASFGGEVLTARGGNDAFIAAFDHAGAHLWSTRIGAEGSEDAFRMWLDGDWVVVGGTFEIDGAFGRDDLTTAGHTDVFVARVATAGGEVRAWSAGGTGHDSLGGLAGGAGGVVITGSFADTASFAGTTLTAGGERSAFVAVSSR